jgi:hypothetical protein
MSAERFIKATEPIQVELNGTTYLVKPLSFKTHIKIQRELRKSFGDDLTAEQKEDAYVSAIVMLAEALNLPTENVLEADSEFISKLIDVFLLQTR